MKLKRNMTKLLMILLALWWISLTGCQWIRPPEAPQMPEKPVTPKIESMIKLSEKGIWASLESDKDIETPQGALLIQEPDDVMRLWRYIEALEKGYER